MARQSAAALAAVLALLCMGLDAASSGAAEAEVTCSPKPLEEEQASGEMMMGGFGVWQECADNTTDREDFCLQLMAKADVACKLSEHCGVRSLGSLKACRFRSQVVAGTHYEVKVSKGTGHDDHFTVKIFEPLSQWEKKPAVSRIDPECGQSTSENKGGRSEGCRGDHAWVGNGRRRWLPSLINYVPGSLLVCLLRRK